MNSKPENITSALENWVNSMKPGGDLGPADRNSEGAYRRGYHQAIAEVLVLLESGTKLNEDSLRNWVEVDAMNWRKNVTLERIIVPPELPGD